MAFIARSLLIPCFFVGAVSAQQCDINFNYGVIIDPAHLRIVDHGQTYVQINGQHQLFVRFVRFFFIILYMERKGQTGDR